MRERYIRLHNQKGELWEKMFLHVNHWLEINKGEIFTVSASISLAEIARKYFNKHPEKLKE